MTTAKITSLEIENVKRVKAVTLTPSENGLTVIGGRNGQGKTSILDAICFALGGESYRPSNIANTPDADPYIKLTIGDLIIERKGKNSVLKVTDSRGLKGGQSLLNQFVSELSLNLSKFMTATDAKKAEMLLGIFPELKTELAQIDLKYKTIYDERSSRNSELKRTSVEFDQMTKHADVPEAEISIAQISTVIQNAITFNNDNEKQRNELKMDQQTLDMHVRQFTDKQAEISRIKEQIKALETLLLTKNEELEKIVETGKEFKAEFDAKVTAIAELKDIDVAPLHQQISDAEKINARIRENIRRVQTGEKLTHMRQYADGLTKKLDDLKDARIKLLSNAKLPLPELSIDEAGDLLYKNQKWDCMSGAEKLKVATAICATAKPECGFVLLDGLEAMDTTTLTEFSTYLTEHNLQGIGTRVSSGDECSIVIEDGMAVSNNTNTEKE